MTNKGAAAVGTDAHICPPFVELTLCGKSCEKHINSINTSNSDVLVDKYVIMPNHIHMILFFNIEDTLESGSMWASTPTTLKKTDEEA